MVRAESAGPNRRRLTEPKSATAPQGTPGAPVRDIRVPREEATQVVEILKNHGRTVDVVYYPQEGHVFMKREDQIDEITRMVAWFDRYLKGAH